MNINKLNLTRVNTQDYDKFFDINKDITKVNLDTSDIKEISDRTDFSINYSKNTVASVIGDIKSNFEDSLTSVYQDKSIADNAALYGDILNRINSKSEFNDTEKIQLTRILDSSFENFAKGMSNIISKDISGLLNKAYNAEKSYEENGTDMGIEGQALVNQNGLQKNIEDMFSTSKIFYKNNPDGTKEQLQKYLEDKFSSTKNIEDLSYKDFTTLQKAVDISLNRDSNGMIRDTDFYTSVARQNQAMKTAIDTLKKDGVSSVVIDTYKKAAIQNNNCHRSIEVFGKLRYSYEKKMDTLFALEDSQELKLKELKKKIKEMIEKYRKEMEKIKEDTRKLMMNSLKNRDKQIESLSKQQDFDMDNLNKEKVQIEDNIKSLRKDFEDTAKEYKLFLKSPAPFIKEYLSKEDNNAGSSVSA